MNSYKLFINFYYLVRFQIITADWVELPQFSNTEKVYRTAFQVDRFFQPSIHQNGTQLISRSTVKSNNQRVDLIKNSSEEAKTSSKKGLKYSTVNDTTCVTAALPIKYTNKFLQITDLPNPSVAQYKNFESDRKLFLNYKEKEAEDDTSNRQLNQSTTFKNEIHKTCNTDVQDIANISNFSEPNFYNEKEYVNESIKEANKRFEYYLPVKIFKRVNFILKTQPRTVLGKIKFFKNFEKILISEVESRLAATILPLTDIKKSNRKKRYDHHEEDSLGFPSLEGALMAISFLTFAVYLVRLIMLLFQNFNPTTGNPTIFLGRRKRSINHFNEDVERILGYLNK